MKRSAGVHRNNRGMTLVELMAGFAILAIVMAVALSMMLFSSNILNVDAARDRMKMLGDDTYNAIQQTLTFATHVEVRQGPTVLSYAKYDNVIYVNPSNNRLYRGTKAHTEPWFAEDTYPHRDVELIMQVKVLDDDTLLLKLTYQLKGATPEARIETLYETESAFRILNLSAGTDPVKIETSGSPNPSGYYVNSLISYDGAPYQIEEGGGGELWTGGPYTVAKHPKAMSEKIKGEFESEGVYQKGDIVIYNGRYYKVDRDLTLHGDPGWYPDGASHYWILLEEHWDSNSRYLKYDVVAHNGLYYMSKQDVNAYQPPEWSTWVQVYWFADKATMADPMLGWSLDKITYKSVYEKYPK